MCDWKSGAWPCPGADSDREVGPCCSLKWIHKQKDFGCNKIQLFLNNVKFHSVGTLLQLQGYNGDIVIIKCYSAIYLEKAFILLCLSLNCDWWLSSLMTIYLRSTKFRCQNRFIANSSCPAFSPHPNPQGCWFAKACFTANVIYTKEIDLISFLKSSGLLLRLSIMSSFESTVSGCSRLKTGLQQTPEL